MADLALAIALGVWGPVYLGAVVWLMIQLGGRIWSWFNGS